MSATKNVPPAMIDPLRRYDVNTARALLSVSRKTLYEYIASGRIKVIREGTRRLNGPGARGRMGAGRLFVPASEIIKMSRVPK